MNMKELFISILLLVISLLGLAFGIVIAVGGNVWEGYEISILAFLLLVGGISYLTEGIVYLINKIEKSKREVNRETEIRTTDRIVKL